MALKLQTLQIGFGKIFKIMIKLFKEMKALMTKSLLFSIIFSSSIVILVFILMDIFIFNNYSINTIIQAVVVGPVIGIVNHLILKNRVKQR